MGLEETSLFALEWRASSSSSHPCNDSFRRKSDCPRLLLKKRALKCPSPTSSFFSPPSPKTRTLNPHLLNPNPNPILDPGRDMAAEIGEIDVSVVSKPEESRSVFTPSAAAEIHVLAVDDSVLDRKVIERLLRTSSYKVTTVDSGNKALEVLGIEGTQGSMQINVSLIITDYCMPGMTGYDLLKRVKGASSLKEIPVVIMSSENVPNRIQRCLEEGAEEFIMKPVQMADVERLKVHIRPPSSAFRVDQSSVSCNKRKFGSEGYQVQSPERRPRLSGVTVA